MKQRQYNAFEIEFKSHTLDKEEFLNMDETDKTNYLDFLTEKEIRLRELETGICRLMDSEMDGDTTKGSLLDFIW